MHARQQPAPAHCCPRRNYPAQSHNPTEPSEEVRLQLVQLLALIMDQAGPAIAAYASEVWSMLTALLVDKFHEVAVQGCRVSQQLAGEALTNQTIPARFAHRTLGSALEQVQKACQRARAEQQLSLCWLLPALTSCSVMLCRAG